MKEDFYNKKNIFWDFDGVLIDSMAVRENGFKTVLSEFPEEEVEILLDYHRRNGGLSRYVKFNYFFQTIRKQIVTEETIKALAENFSEIMRNELVEKEILIKDTLEFVIANQPKFRMHIVSGSDGDELRYLCKQLEISRYFKSIEGSPRPKIDLVKDLLKKNKYPADKCLLIGDSINDFEAAKESEVDFYGYNNPKLKGKGKGYINSFDLS